MFKLFIYLILYFFTIGLSTSYAQSQKSQDSLFGITLTGAAKAILDKVETTYNKKIREEWMPITSSQAGNSKVADDGTPIIYLHPLTGRNLSTIVHELYHFIQRAEGYPIVLWLMPAEMDTKENQQGFRQLNQQVYDPVLHYSFFDTLRSLNIHPNEAFELGTREIIQNGTLDSLFKTMDVRAIGLYYFKAKLELQDESLLTQIVTLLKKNNKQEGLDLGERISRIIINANPITKKNCVDILVECLDILYSGQFDFVQREWTTRQLGNHRQVIASIELRVL
jgi:hypothetical protein